MLNLGINQLMSDIILRLRIESEIDPSSVFELGSRGNRNLRISTRNFRKYPDTPLFHPDTPELEVYITRFDPFYCFQTLQTIIHSPFSPSPRSLSSQALNTKSTIPNPSQDLESCKSAWRIIPSTHSSLGWFQF